MMTAIKTPISETEFLAQVIQLAKVRGWLVYHQRPARTAGDWRTAVQGHAGFPDLVLARKKRLLFAELKSEKGVTTKVQDVWLAALQATYTPCYVWRPSDWPEIEQVLT